MRPTTKDRETEETKREDQPEKTLQLDYSLTALHIFNLSRRDRWFSVLTLLLCYIIFVNQETKRKRD